MPTRCRTRSICWNASTRRARAARSDRVRSGTMKRVTRVVVGISALAFAWAAPRAQQRTAQYQVEAVGDRTGAAGLSLALRKLGTVGSLMHTTAHPDDENNAVLALHARRLGMRV